MAVDVQREGSRTGELSRTALIVLVLLLVLQLALMNSEFEGYTVQAAPLLYVVLALIFSLLLAPGIAMLKAGAVRHGWIIASSIAGGLLIIYFWIFFAFYLAPFILELVCYSRLPGYRM